VDPASAGEVALARSTERSEPTQRATSEGGDAQNRLRKREGICFTLEYKVGYPVGSKRTLVHGSAMVRFIPETWLVTTLFMIVEGIMFLVSGKWEMSLVLALLTLVVIPPVWWRIVARRPTPIRGAFAGAIGGGAIILILTSVLVLVHLGEKWGDLEIFVLVLLLAFNMPLAMMIGVIIGIVTIYWMRLIRTPEGQSEVKLTDGTSGTPKVSTDPQARGGCG
jgi:hypothetical protein